MRKITKFIAHFMLAIAAFVPAVCLTVIFVTIIIILIPVFSVYTALLLSKNIIAYVDNQWFKPKKDDNGDEHISLFHQASIYAGMIVGTAIILPITFGLYASLITATVLTSAIVMPFYLAFVFAKEITQWCFDAQPEKTTPDTSKNLNSALKANPFRNHPVSPVLSQEESLPPWYAPGPSIFKSDKTRIAATNTAPGISITIS